jgi:hypothetical protein
MFDWLNGATRLRYHWFRGACIKPNVSRLEWIGELCKHAACHLITNPRGQISLTPLGPGTPVATNVIKAETGLISAFPGEAEPYTQWQGQFHFDYNEDTFGDIADVPGETQLNPQIAYDPAEQRQVVEYIGYRDQDGAKVRNCLTPWFQLWADPRPIPIEMDIRGACMAPGFLYFLEAPTVSNGERRTIYVTNGALNPNTWRVQYETFDVTHIISEYLKFGTRGAETFEDDSSRDEHRWNYGKRYR